MSDDRGRQPDRPDYAEAVEPRCPECGQALVIEFDEQTGLTDYRCPRGHAGELSGEESSSQARARTGELGEDR